MKKGDIFSIFIDQKYEIYKIIAVDEEVQRYHCVVYSPMETKPDENRVEGLFCVDLHQSIPKKYFSNELMCVFANESILPAEMDAYIDYLKHTNFLLYCRETGQDADELWNKITKHLTIGKARFYKGKYLEALPEFMAAYDIHPYYPDILDRLGRCYLKIGDYPNAVQYLEYAHQVAPRYSSPLMALGDCYLRMREYKKVRKVFREIKKLDPRMEAGRRWMRQARFRLFFAQIFRR